MKAIKNTWEKLPDLAKVVVIIVLILIIIRSLNWIKNFATTLAQGSSNQGAAAAYTAQGETKSYSDIEYKQMADRLDLAMRGAGTDYEEVFSVMELLQNNLDAVQLNKAFGVREYTAYFMTYRASLLEWLEDDLNSSYMDRLWNMLETKGITYRFT